MNDTPTTQTVEEALSGLATSAPEGLADRIMAATGIADRMAVIAGPIGPLCVVFNDRGITGCAPAEQWDEYRERHSAGQIVEVDELPARLHTLVVEALDSGKLGRLPVDLDRLTPFQQAVLRKTAEIPVGEVRPYGWVAREIGKPGAVRAVGSALNKNPIPVLIPCHRVSRSDGHLGQYAYGPAMKRRLLASEGLDPDAVEALADRGVRYLASVTGTEYCLPTCRGAKEIQPENRIEFRSLHAAHDAGYGACTWCRPAA